MPGNVVPTWVKRTALALMIVEEHSPDVARQHLVEVPVGHPVKDGNGGKRPAMKGERRPLGEFIGRRQLFRIAIKENVKEARAQRAEEHRARLRKATRKNDEAIVQQMPLLSQGLRPQVDKYGEIMRENGRILYERLPPQVQVQAWQVGLRMAERAEGPAPQKVEMEHSGGMKITASTPEEIEELRKATIERIAARLSPRDSG